MRGVGLAMLASALVVGCGDPAAFTLRLGWSTSLARQNCNLDPTDTTAVSCKDLPVSCDARVRLRVVDAEDATRVFYSECFDLPAGGDLCGLGDLAIPSGTQIPNRMVRIQLQVWTVDELADRPVDAPRCPTDPEFDERGLPKLDALVDPVPAVGGEIYFSVGDSEVASLELGCPDLDQLDTEACRTRAVTVNATVLVPGAGRSVNTAEAADLEVSFGTPIVGDDGLTRLPRSELVELEPIAGAAEPRWVATVAGPIEGLRCLRVREGEALSTPVASCQVATVLPSASLPMTGYRLESSQINDLLALADREFDFDGIFPIAGIVLGLVVDVDNHLLPGVTVTPSEGSVIYPDATLQGTVLGATGSTGLFLSLDAPIDTSWAAVGSDDTVADGSARGGLISNHLTVVVVRMRAGSSGAR